MKKVLKKWQLYFHFGKDYRTMERGWKQVEFGILNIQTLPPEGELLWSKYYKGFLLKFYIWLPIDF